jgi:predicted CXXCH cytochrome family protein
LIECSECHVASEPGAPVEITLAAKVADCTLCHGHRGTERAYSGVSATEVQSCVRCHQVGVPAKGEPVPVERARLAVAPGSAQIHSGRKSCRECHRVDAGAAPADAAKVPVELRRVSIVRGGSLSAHDHRKFHPKLSAEEQMNTALQNYLDEAACMDCHWGRMELPRSNHALMEDLTERIKVERLKRYAQYDARDPDAYRRNFGNQLDEPGYSGGFPGVSRPLVK